MLTILLAAAIAVAPARAVEPVDLRPRFTAAESFAYDAAAEFRVRSEGTAGSDAPREASVDQRARMRFTTRSVAADGSATVEVTFERLTATGKPGSAFADGAAAEKAEAAAEWIAWEEGDKPAAPAEGASPMASMYHALAGAILVLEVDAQGQVTAVRGLRPVLEAGDGATWEARSRALGMFAPGAIKSNLSLVWRVDPGKGPRPRNQGDAWSITDTLSLGESGDLELTTRCTLGAPSAGEPVVEGTTEARFLPPEGDKSLPRPRLEVTKGAGRVRAVWDRAAGRIREREDTLDLAWKATLDLADPIGAGAESFSRLRFTPVAEGPKAPRPAPEPEPAAR